MKVNETPIAHETEALSENIPWTSGFLMICDQLGLRCSLAKGKEDLDLW